MSKVSTCESQHLNLSWTVFMRLRRLLECVRRLEGNAPYTLKDPPYSFLTPKTTAHTLAKQKDNTHLLATLIALHTPFFSLPLTHDVLHCCTEHIIVLTRQTLQVHVCVCMCGVYACVVCVHVWYMP